MHNPSITYTASASPSLRAELNERHHHLEQCSVTHSYSARSHLETQRIASHHPHHHRTCIRTAHACIARIPLAEFSTLSISVSITPAFNMPLASHSSICIYIVVMSHDFRCIHRISDSRKQRTPPPVWHQAGCHVNSEPRSCHA